MGLKLALDEDNYTWFTSAAENFCQQRGLDYIDLNAVWKVQNLDEKWFFVDMCHLNDDGFALAARRLVDKLRSPSNSKE